MKTKIEDTQLDTELQELYIVSSHWNSDIDFVQDEIRLLKNALNKYHAWSETLQADETARFYRMLEAKDEVIPTLKNAVAVFLKFMEPLITYPVKKIGLDMLEKFNVLQSEVRYSVEYIKLVRNLVFAFIEDAIRSGKYFEPPVATNPVKIKKRRSLIYSL